MIYNVVKSKKLTVLSANPVVQAFIISETFFFSAWNFITPIFAVFVLTIPGGNIEVAGICYSVHLLTRIIAEIIIGKTLTKASDKKRFFFTLYGMILLSVSYLLLIFATNVITLYIVWAIIGSGVGIVAPAKNSLFAMHLDKDREAEEWGICDAIVFTGVAFAATLGGFIANRYGFITLFVLSSIFNCIGMIPYILYLRSYKTNDLYYQKKN